MHAVSKITKKLKEMYNPMNVSVTLNTGGLRIILVTDLFEDMSADARMQSVRWCLGDCIDEVHNTPKSYFLMSSSEYVHAYKCPTFNGI